MYGIFAPNLLCFSAWPDDDALAGFLADAAGEALREDLGIADMASTSGRPDPKFHASQQPFTMRYNPDAIYDGERCAGLQPRADRLEEREFRSVIGNEVRG